MSRPIFHELQIEAVQHGADRDAEKHSKNAEHLAVLPPAHNVPSGGRADTDCKEVFHSFNSHSILGKMQRQNIQLALRYRQAKRGMGMALRNRQRCSRPFFRMEGYASKVSVVDFNMIRPLPLVVTRSTVLP